MASGQSEKREALFRSTVGPKSYKACTLNGRGSSPAPWRFFHKQLTAARYYGNFAPLIKGRLGILKNRLGKSDRVVLNINKLAERIGWRRVIDGGCFRIGPYGARN